MYNELCTLYCTMYVTMSYWKYGVNRNEFYRVLRLNEINTHRKLLNGEKKYNYPKFSICNNALLKDKRESEHAYSKPLCIMYKMHTIKCILFGRNNRMCVRVIERFLFFGFFFFISVPTYIRLCIYLCIYVIRVLQPALRRVKPKLVWRIYYCFLFHRPYLRHIII